MKIIGCFRYGWTACYKYPFAPGSIAYRCDKAKKGVMEMIAIKKVCVTRVNRILYTDTLNSFYFIEDLCDKDTAVAIATAYYQKKLTEVDELLALFSCP